MDLGRLIASVMAGPLGESDADALFDAILRGQLDPAQIAGVLALIAARGPGVDEVVGAARAMRRHVTPTPVRDPASVIDTCGTGGAPKTFNVSTAAAIVAAAAGARVAKHGNRSRTGRGSAEVLAALGVNIDAGPAVQARCLDEAGVCFCFAIHHHPAMRYAGPVRRALKFPTIFNVLGPLTNPAGAGRQLIGVYDPGLVELVAAALARLGSERAMVVHSHDGLDEVSAFAPTAVGEVTRGAVSMSEIDPAGLVTPGLRRDDVLANDVAGSASMVRAVLDGQAGAPLEMVVLNAGAALVVAGVAPSLDDGVVRALAAIASGAAARTLRTLADASHRPV